VGADGGELVMGFWGLGVAGKGEWEGAGTGVHFMTL
jgi:hypothetical protein